MLYYLEPSQLVAQLSKYKTFPGLSEHAYRKWNGFEKKSKLIKLRNNHIQAILPGNVDWWNISKQFSWPEKNA